jgi:DNA-binding transcriptional ArsR family regulator
VATEEIVLDRADIAALSSDTRVAIVKALDTRPMTVSELAGHLGLAKSTVHEHLSMLADRGMVTEDEDRKWRHYSLTERMRRLLRPGNSHRISILLGTSLVTLTLGAVLLATYFRGYTVQGGSTLRDPLLLFAGEAFLFVTFALWYLVLRPLRKAKKASRKIR